MGFAQFNAKTVNDTLAEMTLDKRKIFFADAGINIMKADSAEAALKLSGLDYEVVGRDIFDENGKKIDGYKRNVRATDNHMLGIVSEKYSILQNKDAFGFLDSLVGDAKFESAGFYGRNEAKNYICMSTEPIKILGDDVQPYINFMNTHDGSGSVRVMFSPVRLVCSNCIARSIKGGTHKVAIRHSMSMNNRLDIAKSVLMENTAYMNALSKEASKLACKPFSKQAFEALAHDIIKIKQEDSDIVKARQQALFDYLMKCYNADDLQNFNNTCYKAWAAFTDYESHKMIFRHTKNEKFANLETVLNGMEISNMVAERLLNM